MKKKNNVPLNLLGLPISTYKEYKLNSLTLAYSGKIHHLEKEFGDDYFNRSILPFRFSIILAIFFYGIFAILDAIMFPELKELFWYIRFGLVTPILVAVILFSYSRHFRRFMQPVISCIMYITGLGIIIMNIYASKIAGDYSYYAGLFLILMFGYTFIRARFIYATIAGWSIVVSYEISALWLAETPIEVFINSNYFFISANIIGMFISYFMENSSRRDFYMRKLLQTEQDKVQAANSTLEKRVEERTRQLTSANRDLKKEIEMRKQHQKEKAKLEAQLLHLQKMETIGTLAGGIAHDFNNILTPILGYTEMALEELPAESTLRYDVEQISNAATRGKDLVQQILTFSRQVDVDKKPIELHHVVKEVMNLIRASFPSNIEIHQDLKEDCGTVLADSTQMHQIIMNICTNAYHAMMTKGGRLEVKLDVLDVNGKKMKTANKIKSGTYVRLSISDTGHGMDKQTISRIFEPFYTKKEVGSGSGLGLSVVHGIVSNYSGTIEVESTPGKGSKFMIYLPQHTAEGTDEDTMTDSATKGNERILFVDDEKEITYMGKKMLESLGYAVDIRTDGISALEELKNDPKKYDLMVTDQAMPKMLGTDLVSAARKICPDLKVIIITGYADSIPKNAVRELGISEIILKPLILSNFSNLIREVLDKKEKVEVQP
jgi:signal transduction histidine kinase/CheY-like chemotaxis protein